MPRIGLPNVERGARGLVRWAGSLVGLAFPSVCIHCRSLVEGSGFRQLCASCAGRIPWVVPPHCSLCGHPFFGMVEEERECAHCKQLVPEYGEGRTAVLMRGPARSLVHELKYHGGLHCLADMQVILQRAPGLIDFCRGACLVPVPLHPRKRRERGYNQSEMLAEALAKLVSGALLVPLLERVGDTPSQTSLNRRERQANLKNAFAMAGDLPLNPEQRYILVDDVFTTGSTLNACAAVLRRAGCLSLDVVTFGHG